MAKLAIDNRYNPDYFKSLATHPLIDEIENMGMDDGVFGIWLIDGYCWADDPYETSPKTFMTFERIKDARLALEIQTQKIKPKLSTRLSVEIVQKSAMAIAKYECDKNPVKPSKFKDEVAKITKYAASQGNEVLEIQLGDFSGFNIFHAQESNITVFDPKPMERLNKFMGFDVIEKSYMPPNSWAIISARGDCLACGTILNIEA